jgi:hypothetical protein
MLHNLCLTVCVIHATMSRSVTVCSSSVANRFQLSTPHGSNFSIKINKSVLIFCTWIVCIFLLLIPCLMLVFIYVLLLYSVLSIYRFSRERRKQSMNTGKRESRKTTFFKRKKSYIVFCLLVEFCLN